MSGPLKHRSNLALFIARLRIMTSAMTLKMASARAVLEDLTPHQPFGYQTSFSVELRDHNGKKSESILEAKASAAIADASAFIFIDAILTLLARGIRTPTNV